MHLDSISTTQLCILELQLWHRNLRINEGFLALNKCCALEVWKFLAPLQSSEQAQYSAVTNMAYTINNVCLQVNKDIRFLNAASSDAVSSRKSDKFHCFHQ